MDIHSLMERFIELGNAEVSRGPKHPTEPNPTLAEEVATFLEQYPFLRKDQGYVDFLECYAGANLCWPGNNLIIEIFGFTEVSSHIVEAEGPIIDANGFLKFCDGIVRIAEGSAGLDGVIGQGFGFDTTLTRKWGIYREITIEDEPSDMHWLCDSFLEWLEMMIDCKGSIPKN